MAEQGLPSPLISDLMLLDLSGENVCRQVRARSSIPDRVGIILRRAQNGQPRVDRAASRSGDFAWEKSRYRDSKAV